MNSGEEVAAAILAAAVIKDRATCDASETRRSVTPHAAVELYRECLAAIRDAHEAQQTDKATGH